MGRPVAGSVGRGRFPAGPRVHTAGGAQPLAEGPQRLAPHGHPPEPLGEGTGAGGRGPAQQMAGPGGLGQIDGRQVRVGEAATVVAAGIATVGRARHGHPLVATEANQVDPTQIDEPLGVDLTEGGVHDLRVVLAAGEEERRARGREGGQEPLRRGVVPGETAQHDAQRSLRQLVQGRVGREGEGDHVGHLALEGQDALLEHQAEIAELPLALQRLDEETAGVGVVALHPQLLAPTAVAAVAGGDQEEEGGQEPAHGGDLCTSPARTQGFDGRVGHWHPLGVLFRLASMIALLLASESALAQGDVFGSNRDQPAASTRPADTYRRSVPDRPYVPDRSKALRSVRLLGDDVVYRLDRPGGEEIYRDMDAIPVVVCAEPPCDVLLPDEVRLAVQARGERFARGQLRVPPGPGMLSARILSARPKRIRGAIISGAMLIASAVLFGYGGAEDPDAFLSFRPVFFGIGTAILIGALVIGAIHFTSPRQGSARWQPARPLALSRHSL